MTTLVQPSLFNIRQIRRPRLRRDASIQERFEAFHDANPQVYDLLRELALTLRRAGARRYSIKGLFEQLRWHYALQTQGEDYKLSNNYHSRYARLLMQQEEELSGFFALRELRTE